MAELDKKKPHEVVELCHRGDGGFAPSSRSALLNGHGPGWEMQLKPQGYVQGNIEETTESLSINTTRCRADLVLSVTLNMVLDGRTETIDITDRIPLTSLLLQGETPAVYAAELD